MARPVLACLDLEGVLVPEIWINVAKKTGISELRLTTRDIADYDLLMKRRLGILDQHRLTLPDIQAVIATMEPLEGASEFLAWLRERCQVIILSDTFYEFAQPLMQRLAYPSIFCNRLEVDQKGRIVNYHLRQPDQKRQSVIALKGLQFLVVAAGDSYNDTSMLAEADSGIFFRPPDAISKEFPQFPVTQTYVELKEAFRKAGGLRP
ncbi:MAG: bifunctional phosphoserine phosphatase/homoserine phosphotransferase ThrH [Nitrospirae bacterium]|nr:MAG: bifunctional phosphoserine phosphatase/homoserine phosphotransferase ThrH [Nitrospirota bacterium]